MSLEFQVKRQSATRECAGEAFPEVVNNKTKFATLDETLAWIATRREQFCRQVEHCGALLFRGFPLTTAQHFDSFVGAFGLPGFAYEDSLSNAVRVNKTPRVFTANEAPPTAHILFHHEMAQTPLFPSKLFFFCENPPDTGGATPLCRSDDLWEELLKVCSEFAQTCQQKGLRYSHVMPNENDFASGMGRSWRSTLKAQTPEQAEARLAALKYSYEWIGNDALRATTPVLRAVWDLPSGRKSFFNQLIAFYSAGKPNADACKSVTFGDGSEIPHGPVMIASELADRLAFDLDWQRGDVVLIDNFICMHGRRPYTGVRKVLASLVAYTGLESKA